MNETEESQALNFCAICSEKPDDAVITSCNHIFCRKCLSKWRENFKECPIYCKTLMDHDIQPFQIKSQLPHEVAQNEEYTENEENANHSIPNERE